MERIMENYYINPKRMSKLTCKKCNAVVKNESKTLFQHMMKHLHQHPQNAAASQSFLIPQRSYSSCSLPNIDRNPEVATSSRNLNVATSSRNPNVATSSRNPEVTTSSRNQQPPTYNMGHNASNFLHPGRNAEYTYVAPSTSYPHQPGPSRQPTYSLAYNASSSLHSRPSDRDILRRSHLQLINNFKKFDSAHNYMLLYLRERRFDVNPSSDFENIGEYDGPCELSDISRHIDNIVAKSDGPSQIRRSI
ncbi:uncharacterized protein LOC105254434 [Camponotus floridanus]|uniref:uncharacterized protein LOC105254434 n=1 Tax=Camponotus floridanus TaxID=104421 RepID=UPI00059DE305|nr:uncharacterized protein LOC105254434 [Camponotus floridanus]